MGLICYFFKLQGSIWYFCWQSFMLNLLCRNGMPIYFKGILPLVLWIKLICDCNSIFLYISQSFRVSLVVFNFPFISFIFRNHRKTCWMRRKLAGPYPSLVWAVNLELRVGSSIFLSVRLGLQSDNFCGTKLANLINRPYNFAAHIIDF